MPDLPTQSVTEEKYKDENGHIIVKKVNQILYKRSCMFYMAVFKLVLSCFAKSVKLKANLWLCNKTKGSFFGLLL